MSEIRPGSSLHYCLLWTPEPNRRFVIDQLVLIQTITDALAGISDIAVADRKTTWWEEEISLLIEQKAQHPSVILCATNFEKASAIPGNQIDKQDLRRISGLLRQLLDCQLKRRINPPQSNAALDAAIVEEFQLCLALTSFWITLNSDLLDPQQHSSKAALAVGRYVYAVNIRHRLIVGDQVFSQECYDKFSLCPQDLLDVTRDLIPSHQLNEPEKPEANEITPGSHKRISSLLLHTIKSTHESLNTVIEDLRVKELYKNKTLHPIWILLVLRQRQLGLWLSNPPRLLQEHSTLTPIRKLTIAWWQYLRIS